MSILYKGNIGGEMKEEELTLLARLVMCAMPIDRTNHLNKFHKNFAPIPTDFSDAQSWEYCCYTRAEELWNIGKPITLFWSGGIDSTVAFLALRDTMAITDTLHIRYTQESIDEFPNLYIVPHFLLDKGCPFGNKSKSNLPPENRPDTTALRKAFTLA